MFKIGRSDRREGGREGRGRDQEKKGRREGVQGKEKQECNKKWDKCCPNCHTTLAKDAGNSKVDRFNFP